LLNLETIIFLICLSYAIGVAACVGIYVDLKARKRKKKAKGE